RRPVGDPRDARRMRGAKGRMKMTGERDRVAADGFDLHRLADRARLSLRPMTPLAPTLEVTVLCLGVVVRERGVVSLVDVDDLADLKAGVALEGDGVRLLRGVDGELRLLPP